jgi:hypothetical protein
MSHQSLSGQRILVTQADVFMGSASALRGMKRASIYSAARGARLAYVQAGGFKSRALLSTDHFPRK